VKKQTFSAYLVKKRNEINLTNSKLASKASISAVYLGEIINNRKNPPDKKTQYALADALQLTENEKIEFFNLAANERGEIPVDIYDYLLKSKDLLNEIRAMKNDGRAGEYNEEN
jgi:transcriptional regulator with XRE-family HTH domain